MTNRQVSRHQTHWLWVRIMWENICFKINSKALYRILESKKKDFEFIEDKSWQDIMMKCFHFTAHTQKFFAEMSCILFVLFPKTICDIATEIAQWISTISFIVLLIQNTCLLCNCIYLYSTHFTFTTFITFIVSWNDNKRREWNGILSIIQTAF